MHQSLAAVLHTIRGVRFVEQIGVGSAALDTILRESESWVDACDRDSDDVIVVPSVSEMAFQKEFEPIEIRALRNSLEVAMLDLGQNEFQTITGFSLDEGKQLLDVLNAALLEPLHLNQAPQSISH